jgi:hypothetical protein
MNELEAQTLKTQALVAGIMAHQSPGGAFLAQVHLPMGPVEDRNCFVNGLVLRELAAVPDTPALADSRRQALAFLLRSKYPVYPYLFSFYPRRSPPFWLRTALYADADDTAVIALELVRAGHFPPEALDYLADNYFDVYCATGSFREHLVHPWHREGVFLTWFTTAEGANPIDCCVNTNVVALLAYAKRTDLPGYAPACAMINEAAALVAADPSRCHHFTPYYPHPAEWYHALAHAVAAGATELRPALAALGTLPQVQPATGTTVPLCSDAGGSIIWTAEVLTLARQLRQHATESQQHPAAWQES